MPLDEWRKLFELSDRHGFVIASRRVLHRDLLPATRPPLGGLEAARAAGPQRLPQPGRVHQPVQAHQRAGHALGLRRRRRGAAQALPALPHLPRQRDEPGGAGGQHRGLERRGARGRRTATLYRAQVRRRSRRCWREVLDVRAARRRLLPVGRRAAGVAGDDVAFARAPARSIQCDGPAGQLPRARGAWQSTPARGRIRMALVADDRRMPRSRAAHRRTSSSPESKPHSS